MFLHSLHTRPRYVSDAYMRTRVLDVVVAVPEKCPEMLIIFHSEL